MLICKTFFSPFFLMFFFFMACIFKRGVSVAKRNPNTRELEDHPAVCLVGQSRGRLAHTGR